MTSAATLEAQEAQLAPPVAPARAGVGPARRLVRLARLPRRWRSGWDGPRTVVAVAAVLSALVAVVMSTVVFPYLSVNNDEAIYRLQAQAFAAGHLFPPAAAPAESYQPWLSVVDGDHYVLKYTPVVPGYYALSLVLTGGFAAGLALLAAAAVVVTYLLAVELLGDRRVGALAAVLVAGSPLTVVQSGLLLPYLPTLVLLGLTLLGVLRGLRQRRSGLVVAAGVTGGLALAARPYDVVLLLLPLAGWLLLRGARGQVGWLVARLAAGVAAPLAALLAFNTAATGSPTRLPFALLEPSDKLGFGVRRLYPTDAPHRFGLDDGAAAVWGHLSLLGIGWVAGGALLVGLAVAAVARRRVPAPAAALGGGAVLMLVGYLGFWGAWLAADLWGGIRYVGPFYVTILLLPLVVLGARGLADAWAARHRFGPVRGRLAGLGLAVTVVGTATATLVAVVPADLRHTAADRRLADLLADQGHALVFVAADPPFLQHPTGVLDNGLRPDGRTVYAVARGRADLAVLADHPDREARRLRLIDDYGRRWTGRPVVWLERLAAGTGPTVRVALRARAPIGAAKFRLVVGVGSQRMSYDLPTGRTSRLVLNVSPAALAVEGAGAPAVTRLTPFDAGTTAVADARPPTPAQVVASVLPQWLRGLGVTRVEAAEGSAVTVPVPLDGSIWLTLRAAGRDGREWTVDRDRLTAVPVGAEGEGQQVTVLAPDGLVDRQGRGPEPALQLDLLP